MEQCQVIGCNCPGQKHHVVFRSQGGLNISTNYRYLCIRHHSDGKEAVHNNREFDLRLKREVQAEYERMFTEEEYTIEQIAKAITYNKARLEKKMKTVPQRAGRYKREDIIRFLMGGKLY